MSAVHPVTAANQVRIAILLNARLSTILPFGEGREFDKQIALVSRTARLIVQAAFIATKRGRLCACTHGGRRIWSPWITHAQSLKPGCQMPDLTQFSGTQLQELTAYLQQLK